MKSYFMKRYIINTFVFLLSMVSSFTTSGRPNQFDYDSYTYNHNGSGGKGDIKHSRILYTNLTKISG